MESSIQRSYADGTATVTVHGEIDFANSDDLSACLRDAVQEWSPTAVRAELSKATFIDSTGLGALIGGYKAATETGARFTVVNPTHNFRRVLDVTGLSQLFGLEELEKAKAVQKEATGA